MKAELAHTTLQRTVRSLTLAPLHGFRTAPAIGITVLGSQLTFTASAGELTTRISLGTGTADGNIAVNLRQLTSAVAAIAPTRGPRYAPVHMHTEAGQLHLAGATTTVTIPAFTGIDRVIPDGELVLEGLTARGWLDALARVTPAATRKDRGVLRGIRLWRDPGSCLVMEATDRIRLHRLVLGEPQPDAHESRLSIDHATATSRILALIPDQDPMQLRRSGHTLVFTANVAAVAVAAPGWDSWPQLEQVLEQVADGRTRFSVDSAAVRDALRRAAALVGTQTPVDVDVDPATHRLTITVPAAANGEPPRLTTQIRIRNARGPALRARLMPIPAGELFIAAGTGDATVQVDEPGTLLGVTSGRFSGAVVQQVRP